MTEPTRRDGAVNQAARRRAIAKQHHPDLGGDPEKFIAAMRGLATTTMQPDGRPRPNQPVVRARRSRVRQVTLTRKRWVMTLRQRLPRPVPGSRRYGRI